MAQHPETEGPDIKYDLIGHGLQLYADGRIQKIAKQECRYLSPIMEIQKISIPFFDENADDLIDELVSIVFTQNMKSMEKYYRWVSKRWAETFGRLHKNLVDTILKYNDRGRKGKYIATLAGSRKWST